MAVDPGPSDTLSLQPWYHGKISRIQAEATVKLEGEFLIRDSISSPGEYVLTTRWKRKALHFQVNRTIEKDRTTYHFEEEQFGSVVDLILFYLNHKKPVTLASGCFLGSGALKSTDPCSSPSSSKDLEAAYMHVLRPGEQKPVTTTLGRHVLVSQANLRQLGSRTLRPVSSYTPEPSPFRVPPPPASLIGRPLPLPIRSPRTSAEDQDDYCDMDYDAMDDVLDASLAKSRTTSMQSIPSVPLSRQFQSCVNLRVASPAPPSPSLRNTARPALPPRPPLAKKPMLPPVAPQKLRTPEEEARDSAFVDYDEPKPKNQDYDQLTKKSDYDQVRRKSDYDTIPAKKSDYDQLPRHEYNSLNKRLSDGSTGSEESTTSMPSTRDSGVYSSTPSPPNEICHVFCSTQLNHLKVFLLNKKPGDIAEAISYEDAKMLRFLGLSEKSGLGADNGLRMLLLPQGNILRKELLARCRNVQWTVVVSIASAGKRDGSRMVRQWIMAAEHLLAKHGNIFGFANIMAALENKMLVSQSHLFTMLDLLALDSFRNLRKTFSELKACDDAHTSGVVIPFLQPVLEIFASVQTHYLDESSFANEIDSLWRWLDRARKWSAEADGLRDAARGRYVRSRAAAENPLADHNLKRLCTASPATLTDAVQKFFDEA